MRYSVIMLLCGALTAWGCSPEVAGPIAFHSEDAALEPPPPPTADECRVPDPPPETIPWSNAAPALEAYCTAFWVTQGEDQELSVGFASDESVKARWFLRLFIPEGAQFVDDAGMTVPDGSRVRVTVAIHRTLYAVQFGPHGSEFQVGRPAVLKLNYSWADLGKQDAKDLTIYYQADEGGTWAKEPTIVDRRGNYVSTWLRHFSNYAVAW